MLTHRNLPLITAACLLLGVVTSPLHASRPPAPGAFEEAVMLTGWLHVEDLTYENAEVVLEMNGEQYTTRVSKSGRFDVSLPAGTEAVLHFKSPGHLTKDLVVDTRFVHEGGFTKEKRHVKFAVVLELERHLYGFHYEGAVGNIGFDKDGGCMNVEHTRRLVVGRPNKTMVF
jgi:hypothetical protein